MIGVVAAIGGLIFSGIATYYGALVSADQLDQTREAAQTAARDQANHISFWTEDEGRAVTFHVQNRSPDPVPSIYLMVAGWGTVHAEGLPPDENAYVYWIRTAPPVPPCAELVFTTKGLSATMVRLRPLAMGKVDAVKPEWFAALRFADRDGQTWERTRWSLQSIDESASPVEMAGLGEWSAYQANSADVLPLPKVKRAVACGGDN
ncbi:hypothetical protein [Streptomyces sp. TLI_55]|uniref:hypothetical protein n=1 Tax=Streptomyces sp. TLI_55 TaxID=1938861 RepID=UPI00117F7FF9|nr:hypothetical protein [Streptomyces sp. TLI_55]